MHQLKKCQTVEQINLNVLAYAEKKKIWEIMEVISPRFYAKLFVYMFMKCMLVLYACVQIEHNIYIYIFIFCPYISFK